MPSKLYDCKTDTYFNSKEEQLEERRRRDNIAQKIRYWRKTYNYDLNKSDYDDFKKNVHIIKKVHKLHDFIINYNQNKKTFTKDMMEIYAKNYNTINKGLEIQNYLKTLKKIGDNDTVEPTENKAIIIDNW